MHNGLFSCRAGWYRIFQQPLPILAFSAAYLPGDSPVSCNLGWAANYFRLLNLEKSYRPIVSKSRAALIKTMASNTYSNRHFGQFCEQAYADS
jgi:hypothetical protein